MSQHSRIRRQREPRGTVRRRAAAQIGMADAGRDDLDENLVVVERRDVHALEIPLSLPVDWRARDNGLCLLVSHAARCKKGRTKKRSRDVAQKSLAKAAD